jgi:3-methyladenine DNA glycosylase/8-oxoguanine DNA glycosylase
VLPRWPYRLRRQGGSDGVARARHGVVERMLHVGHSPVRARAWQTREGYVHIRAEPIDPDLVEHPIEPADVRPPAGPAELEVAIERVRFSLAVEEDMGDFYDAFKRDPLIGPAIHHKPWVRPRRRAWPWEALCWAITEQHIQVSRATEIQRRIVRRWGARFLADQPAPRPRRRRTWPLRDVPSAEVIEGRAPAELTSMDLSPGRAVAMVHCAREVARGRADLGDPDGDRRLLAIPEIGPWTLQCLGYHGRGDPDSLPAGDLAYVKLVGHLEGLGRRATVDEVEEYFAPYAPFRALAGTFARAGWHKARGAGPPARLAA